MAATDLVSEREECRLALGLDGRPPASKIICFAANSSQVSGIPLFWLVSFFLYTDVLTLAFLTLAPPRPRRAPFSTSMINDCPHDFSSDLPRPHLAAMTTAMPLASCTAFFPLISLQFFFTGYTLQRDWLGPFKRFEEFARYFSRRLVGPGAWPFSHFFSLPSHSSCCVTSTGQSTTTTTRRTLRLALGLASAPFLLAGHCALRLTSACVFQDVRIALARLFSWRPLRPVLTLGCQTSRGPLGLALGFYRPHVRCLDVTLLN
jgi:hypothetical protein